MPSDPRSQSRPPRPKNIVTRGEGQKTVTISLDEDLLKLIDLRCKELDEDRSSYLRKCARLELNQQVFDGPHLQPDRSQRDKPSPVKEKRARISDLDWVSLDEYECSAGQPLSPASQPLGQIRVPARFALPGTFVLRINGDSMNAAKLATRLGGPGGIQPGSRVVMQWIEHRDLQEHDIVAACLQGCCTLKRLLGPEGARWLQPESTNPIHHRIDLDSDDRIQAVMIGKL